MDTSDPLLRRMATYGLWSASADDDQDCVLPCASDVDPSNGEPRATTAAAGMATLAAPLDVAGKKPRSESSAAPRKSSTFLLHGAEHNVCVTLEQVDGSGTSSAPIRAPLLPRNRTQITVTHDATAGIIVFGCDNLRSGDTFFVRVNGSYLRKMLPSGFPRGASSLHGFFGLLLDGLASEAGLSVADMPGTTLHCTSREHKGVFAVLLSLTIGSGYAAMEFSVELCAPLAEAANEAARLRVALGALRAEFQAKTKLLETQLQQVRTQLNGRIFFGASSSVRVDCRRLAMRKDSARKLPPLKGVEDVVVASLVTLGEELNDYDAVRVSKNQGTTVGSVPLAQFAAKLTQLQQSMGATSASVSTAVHSFVQKVYDELHADITAAEHESLPMLSADALMPLQVRASQYQDLVLVPLRCMVRYCCDHHAHRDCGCVSCLLLRSYVPVSCSSACTAPPSTTLRSCEACTSFVNSQLMALPVPPLHRFPSCASFFV